jgi:hypothetical protein
MNRRQTEGKETWIRLLEWTRGQSPSERLAALVLRYEGYVSIDPSHPLGGQDGLKDIVCQKDGLKWVGACFFPRGQQSLSEIEKKFKHDLEGVVANSAQGLAFVTNQELRLSERHSLEGLGGSTHIDLYHLERLTSLLNSPELYGVRLEFLDIEMEKEEQISFIASRDKIVENLQLSLSAINTYFVETGSLNQNKLDDILSRLSQQSAAQGPVYVTPEYAGSSWGTLPFSTNVHTCSYCKYGYLISANPGQLVVGGGNNTITCPKCGNTENHSPLFTRY